MHYGIGVFKKSNFNRHFEAFHPMHTFEVNIIGKFFVDSGTVVVQFFSLSKN